MAIFGWRLTNKKPQVESDRIQHLQTLLETEQRHREEQRVKSENKEVELKILLSKAEAEERARDKSARSKSKSMAIVHLKAAERYNEQAELSTGARKAELKAIVENRLEKVKQLGIHLDGSITETIGKLS